MTKTLHDKIEKFRGCKSLSEQGWKCGVAFTNMGNRLVVAYCRYCEIKLEKLKARLSEAKKHKQTLKEIEEDLKDKIEDAQGEYLNQEMVNNLKKVVEKTFKKRAGKLYSQKNVATQVKSPPAKKEPVDTQRNEAGSDICIFCEQGLKHPKDCPCQKKPITIIDAKVVDEKMVKKMLKPKGCGKEGMSGMGEHLVCGEGVFCDDHPECQKEDGDEQPKAI